MVEAILNRRITLSKWSLSPIFKFLPIRDAMQTRRASKLLNEACLVGWNIGVQDLQEQVDRCLVAISMRFSAEEQQRHKQLRGDEMQIN